MGSRLREAAVPAYLLVCLLLGGSVQGVWSNMTLQLLGLAIIAWSALARGESEPTRSARMLMWVALLGLVVIAVQLVPLPATVWPHLGGRERIASDFALLGLRTPSLPLSLAPYETLGAILALIPPIAVLCAMLRLRAYRSRWLTIPLAAAAMVGILIGVLQVSGGPMSPWYIYEETSRGLATGTFANANHMATLLLVCLPFLAALLASMRGSKAQHFSAMAALVGGLAIVILVGVALNQSLAGYFLAVPVVILSVLILLPSRSGLRKTAGAAAGAFLLIAMIALWLVPIGSQSLRAGAESSVLSRQQILATSGRAAADLMPFGSGAGTFRSVYQLYEDHDRLERAIVNHAHNEYVEIAVETGVPGILLLAAFLIWWFGAAAKAWRPGGSPFARAAAVASAAILMHSFVDFPLRTAAIATVFAMCLGLLAEPKLARQRSRHSSELRPTRHLSWE
jgi:O-antigen ligase